LENDIQGLEEFKDIDIANLPEDLKLELAESIE
jgi:hypothetical protein